MVNQNQTTDLSPEQIKSGSEINNKYRANPALFLTEVLDTKPEYVWGGMHKMLESVRDHKKTCVKAAHSVSKTYTMGRAVLWFLYNFHPSTVITTAPGKNQVEELLWREIRSAHANAEVPLGGTVTKTKIDLQEETGDIWFAYGFSTRPDTVTNEATRMQGYHNKHVLIVFDEAAGIVREIWHAAWSLMASGHIVRFVAIGNPTSPDGEFVECFKDPTFNKITISVFDTPNYIEGREVIPGLSGREYEAETARKFGKDSNYYRARVKAEIPDDDPDALITAKWIDSAEERDIQTIKQYVKRFVVIDVADGDDDTSTDRNVRNENKGEHDRTVIKAFENKMEIDSLVLKNKKIEECEPYVWRMLRKINGNCIIYDGDGIGRVMGRLLRASKDEKTKIIPFMGSSKLVNNKQDFETRYSEGHWAMREDFESGLISIVKDPDVRREIRAIKLVNHPKGFITIEKKKFLRKRIGGDCGHKDVYMMMSAEFDNVPIHYKNESWGSYKNNNAGAGSAMAA